MKIFTKILLTLVIMAALLFGSLYALLQWSFDEGMLNYVNQRELQSLQLLSDNLLVVHGETKDLTVLASRPKIWHETLRASIEARNISPFEIRAIIEEQNKSGKPRRPPPKYRDDSNQHHRPPQGDRHHDMPHTKRPPISNRSGLDPSRFPSLLDVDKNAIIGRVNDDFSFLEIKSKNTIVGYLAIPPTTQLRDSFDLAFSESQQSTWLIIFAGVFSIAFIVAVALSRYLVKSIQTIGFATHQLNSGNYKTILKPRGKDEIANLARNFNDLAQTLSHNEDSRKAWLANISHELRTPLAILKGEIEALQDGIRPVTEDNLQSLADEISHLQTLINDLNQLANAEIGALNYQKQKINLTELLRQNLARRELDITKQGFNFSSQLPANKLAIWADETRLNQLFDNIITNSLKYTDSPGELMVALKQEGKNAILTFEDSAPNVPNEALDNLFTHLYRVENSRNRNTGGSGLGLAICQKIVEAHQGKISAENSALGGLTIKIQLPLI